MRMMLFGNRSSCSIPFIATTTTLLLLLLFVSSSSTRNLVVEAFTIQSVSTISRTTSVTTSISTNFIKTHHRSSSFASTTSGTKRRHVRTMVSDPQKNNEQYTPTTAAAAATTTTTISEEIRQDADNALASVGWSMPADGELTSNDPFVKAIDVSVQNEMGVSLDELLNPAKVVNLERDLYNYRTQLATLTGKTDIINNNNNNDNNNDNNDNDDGGNVRVTFLTTSDCDGGGGGEEADKIRTIISKKEADLVIERRSVFRGWLKNIFLAQAIISFGLSYVMATNPYTLFGMYDWYNVYNMDISISVLGYWWWWLFVIPSLRSRRPKGYEKNALDIAFLTTPLLSLVAPVVTKDTSIIWTMNFIVVIGSYLYAYIMDVSTINDDNNNNNNDSDDDTPAFIKFVYKSLDFGSGRERGARQ